MKKAIIEWFFSILAAFILFQTLYFKFTASEESVYVFSKIEMEPWGRIGVGVVELIASVMLLIPKTRFYGALIGLSVMSGAIFFHLGSLGIEVMNDGGLLFCYALTVFFSCFLILRIRKNELPMIGKK